MGVGIRTEIDIGIEIGIRIGIAMIGIGIRTE